MPKEIAYGYGFYPRGAKPLKLRPAILVPFVHATEDLEIQMDALIDSGADSSVSFKEIGENLGLKFQGPPREELGLVGTSVRGWKMPIRFKLEWETIEASVIWADRSFDPRNDFSFILGRDILFELYDVTFARNKSIIFRK